MTHSVCQVSLVVKYNLLLNIHVPLAGGQSLEWTNHECDTRHESLAAQMHFGLNMNKSFTAYTSNHSTILNSALEFPVTLVWTETRILRTL